MEGFMEYAKTLHMMVSPIDEAYGFSPACMDGGRAASWKKCLVSDAIYLFDGEERSRPVFIPIIRLWGEEKQVRRVRERIGGLLLSAGGKWGLLLRLMSPGPVGDWPRGVAEELGLAWFPYSPFPGIDARIIEDDEGRYVPGALPRLMGYRPLPANPWMALMEEAPSSTRS